MRDLLAMKWGLLGIKVKWENTLGSKKSEGNTESPISINQHDTHVPVVEYYIARTVSLKKIFELFQLLVKSILILISEEEEALRFKSGTKLPCFPNISLF